MPSPDPEAEGESPEKSATGTSGEETAVVTFEPVHVMAPGLIPSSVFKPTC
jgi:hypothetical protein